MDKEAEDLVEAVDDDVAASKAEKHDDARKDAQETSSTTAEAAESASDDVELADEAGERQEPLYPTLIDGATEP